MKVIHSDCTSMTMRFLAAREESCMEKEPRAYQVRKLTEPITIDGEWNKSAWMKMKPLPIEQNMGVEPNHRPKTLAKLAWDDHSLYLIFHVRDRYVRAVAKQYQDPVCADSCVEFFFTPGSRLGFSYFNMEINCGGTMLFWWHPEGKKAIPVAAEDSGKVEIGHTLPRVVDPEIVEPTSWILECRVPFTVLQKYCPRAVKPAPDVIWKANFYKCGDATSHPHWLTWSFVDYPKPKFHLPQSFGVLEFL